MMAILPFIEFSSGLNSTKSSGLVFRVKTIKALLPSYVMRKEKSLQRQQEEEKIEKKI